MLTLKLTPNQANLLLRGLGKLSLEESIDTFTAVRNQLQDQLNGSSDAVESKTRQLIPIQDVAPTEPN
jgi:hypothetical protein